MSDSLLVLDARTSGLRLYLTCAAELARDAAHRHDLASGSAAALAQGLAGALLLVSTEEAPPDRARVDLQLECKGPLRGLLVDADGTGSVRGMVRVADLDRHGLRQPGAEALVESAPLRRFDSAPLLHPAGPPGEDIGMLSVLRRWPQAQGGLHRALVPFAGGELAAALTSFLQGEGSAGQLSLEVLTRAGEPLAEVAGALVVPLSEDGIDAAARVGQALRDGGLARMLLAGDRPRNAHALAARLAQDQGLGALQLVSEARPRFSCRCSRDRLVAALRTLGAPELLDMAHKDGGAEATCDFCAESYVVSGEELVALAGAGERV